MIEFVTMAEEHRLGTRAQDLVPRKLPAEDRHPAEIAPILRGAVAIRANELAGTDKAADPGLPHNRPRFWIM